MFPALGLGESSQGVTISENPNGFFFESPWLRVGFSRAEPKMTFLSVDAAGTGRVQRNLLKMPVGGAPELGDARVETNSSTASAILEENKIQYPPVKLADGSRASLAVTVEPKCIRLGIDRAPSDSSQPNAVGEAPALWSMMFDATVTPASPLGRIIPDPIAVSPASNNPAAARNVLIGPVLLHFPDFGSLLLKAGNDATSDEPLWQYSLFRDLKPVSPGTVAHWRVMTPEERAAMERIGNPYLLAWNHVHIGPEQNQLSLEFPSTGPSNARRHTELTMTVTAIYPHAKLVDADPRLDGLKRAWLNIFGFRADLGLLANNSTGDACQFVLYCYADQAFYTPPLFDDFTALDLVRISLDRYFDGLKGYSDNFQDVAPSTIIAAWDYVAGKNDREWLKRRIGKLEEYADRMLLMDRDGDGLCESPTGHSSNWWDMFHYGGKDAYSSALAWRAFRCLADLEHRLGENEKAKFYRKRADMIKKVYYATFYDPATGVLAGWRANDGQLKDKYFLWANGIAIAYGLVTRPQANAILDRLQAKMQEVGYTNFQYGLPGNLVTAGSDFPLAKNTFPVYENGAATGSMAYFYVQALYASGRTREADAIFDRMLEGYRDGTFQNGIGNGGDWKTWSGTPNGYEGMLVDAYYPLTAWITGRLGKGVRVP